MPAPLVKRLFQGKTSGGSATYTAPVGQTVVIKSIWIANSTGAAATVTMNLYASGGSADSSNRLVYLVSVDSQSNLILGEMVVLAPGDTLSITDATDAMNYTIFGEIQ